VAIAEVTGTEFAVRILGSNGELLDLLTLRKSDKR